jgi:hypothetical protein
MSLLAKAAVATAERSECISLRDVLLLFLGRGASEGDRACGELKDWRLGGIGMDDDVPLVMMSTTSPSLSWEKRFIFIVPLSAHCTSAASSATASSLTAAAA